MKEPEGTKVQSKLYSCSAVDLLPPLCYAALLAGIYYSTFGWLISHDWAREDYNYAYLVPLIVLYLIWEKKSEVFARASGSFWAGIIPLMLGLCVFWVGELSGEFFSLYLSFWLLIVGLVLGLIGWEGFKVMWFPVLFVLAMFPAPNFLHTKLTGALQLISSKLGVLFIQAYGMSAYREGNVIDLGFTQLQVVEACSGLRYVIPLFILGVLMAYFFKSAWWKRVILVLSTIPLSIFVNSFRIASTGVLYKHWGAEVAEGFFHGFSGWLIFIFCLPVLTLFMWVLGKVPPKASSRRSVVLQNDMRDFHCALISNGQRSEVSGPAKTHAGSPLRSDQQKIKAPQENTRNQIDERNQTNNSPRGLLSSHFIVTVVLLGGTLALSHGIEFREKIPMAKPISQFPLQVGQWSGTSQTMEQKFIDTLDLTDYVIIDYKNPAGLLVDFYVAYYESQRKGESIHSPETCLPGGGWVFEQSGQRVIPVAGYANGAFKVNRAYIQKGPYKQLSYFWFPMRGRILTNAYQMKIYTFWDALTKRRTDGALVRLITPVSEAESVEDADRRLTKFTQEIVPVLDQFLPGRNATPRPDETPSVANVRQAVQK